MQVKLDSYYSIAEVDDLLAALVITELVTWPEVRAAEQARLFNKLTLNFFTVNELLLPFPEKIVWADIPDGETHDKEVTAAYAHFIDRLLLAPPLSATAPTCHLVTANPASHLGLALHESSLRVGETSILFDYAPNYSMGVVFAVNELLNTCGIDAGYHTLDINGQEGFLLLTHQRYQYLLANRVLLFKYHTYPEIDAWRVATLRAEGLLF
jgi:hypothetical protein